MTARTFRPTLETLEARRTPAAAFLGGHARVQLLAAEGSLALLLHNETVRVVPPAPVFGLLTAAVPPSPVVPTSFQGVLGGSAVALNINADGATLALPGGAVLVPPNPCLPGLLTAARWSG